MGALVSLAERTERVATTMGRGRNAVAPHEAREFQRGKADGAQCKAGNGRPSTYMLIARDDYAAGFRAGYFGRHYSHDA